MKVIEKTDATRPLAEYADEIAAGPLVLTSQGDPVAVLVSIENADLETVSLSTNRKFLGLIERSEKRTAPKAESQPKKCDGDFNELTRAFFRLMIAAHSSPNLFAASKSALALDSSPFHLYASPRVRYARPYLGLRRMAFVQSSIALS